MGYISRRVIPALIIVMVVSAGRIAAADMKPRTVDLLKLIDPDKDVDHGKWKLDHEALVSGDEVLESLAIPYQPPEEFDLHVEFTRMSGNNMVYFGCPYFGHGLDWAMGLQENTICELGMDDRTYVDKEHPTRIKVRAVLQNGRKYSALIQVRKGFITESMDGKVVLRCPLDVSRLDAVYTPAPHKNTLRIGSQRSPTAFSVIELSEISGPGRLIPHQNGDPPQDDQQVTEKKQDEPNKTPEENNPVSGPTTRVSNPVASIKALQVYTTDSGTILGQTSKMILTVTRGDASKVTSARYVMPVSDEMSLASDEALRFIRVSYPNWYADTAEVTFEDKGAGQNGGSNGAAFATLIFSAIQGFNIDPNAAITGDISADGNVGVIKGVSTEIRAAAAGQCDLVAMPMGNYEQLVDAVVYNGPAIVSDIQVVGIANLDDAVAVMRSDRDPKLVQGLALFDGIQQSIKKSSGYLHSKEAQERLAEVLQLAPHHLSAKLLLTIAQNNLPKTLSPSASMYYTSASMQAMWPILAGRTQLNQVQVSAAAVKQGLDDLKKLRLIADPSIYPLIDACTRFTWGWSQFHAGNATIDTLLSQSQAVDDALAKLQVDKDLMQKMLKEGM